MLAVWTVLCFVDAGGDGCCTINQKLHATDLRVLMLFRKDTIVGLLSSRYDLFTVSVMLASV